MVKGNRLHLVAATLLVYTASFLTASAQNKKMIDSANMDQSIKPGDDFYLYANGQWIRKNPVPAKETRWGSFNELRDFNINAVRAVLENARDNKSAQTGSVEKRVGDFYAAGMDSLTIEKRGYMPIQPDLQRVREITDLAGVLREVAYLRTVGLGSPMFGFSIGQDRKNVTNIIAQLSQGGTFLSDRDYYLLATDRNLKIQAAYKKYLVTLFTLTGTPASDAAAKAQTIFDIEKRFAAAQMSRVEMRDPYKTYHKFAIAEFCKSRPNINWKNLVSQMKVTGQDTFLVNNPSFFTVLDSMITTVPVNDWKTYLEANVLRSSASMLSKPFTDANFAYNQVLTGQRIQTPRWQIMSSNTDVSMGELLGQLYVEKYFKAAAKARMEELVNNLRKAYAIRINKLDWMSAATKQKALAKLAAFRPKIAYPNKWETYDGLVTDRGNYFENGKSADVWRYNKMISQLGKPVDRERWGMTPPTVNAYYNATLNEIVFPAGILQFPFFDPNADDAINYGGIGAVIGHEMSHGFDDSGSQYDADGTLRNWWTDEDRAKFKAKTDALQKQFDAYTVLDTMNVNGKLTMGENIGDLGGLNVAYEAFKLTKQGQSTEKIDGFTPDQRFFLSWAQVWRSNILDAAAAQQVITDPHSPGQYRTIGALVNMDVWYAAFNVKPGDKLYKKPEERIRMW